MHVDLQNVVIISLLSKPKELVSSMIIIICPVVYSLHFYIFRTNSIQMVCENFVYL